MIFSQILFSRFRYNTSCSTMVLLRYLCSLVVLLFAGTTSAHVKFSHDNIRSVSRSPDPDIFANDLFRKYGANGSITIERFGDLLAELGLRGKKPSGSSTNGSPACYPPKILWDSFSVNASGLRREGFEKVCPALVQQIESKACAEEESESNEEGEQANDKTSAWGFGFLAVTIISVSSLLGAFVVPFMSKSFYKILLLFMVSLAVGVLCGSGVFHLIPHAFGFGQDGDFGYLWKCLTIVAGIYLFFFLEYVMKMIVRHKERQLDKPAKVFEVNGHGAVAGTDIAQVQLEAMYTLEPEKHSHSHAHGFPPSENYINKKDPENGKHNLNGAVASSATSSGKKRIKPVAWMIIIGDGLHNFIDGLAIGASFSTSNYVGLSTALAIFCEELPHELGDFAVLLNAGLSYRAAMFFNFLSACSCYVGLVIGLLLGYTTSAVKWIYAIAGGMFVYISLVDMLEEATEMTFREGAGSIKKQLKVFALQNFGMLFGLTLMFILALYGGDISV